MAGLPMTTLYADGPSMMRKSAITVAWRSDSPTVNGSLIRPFGVTASPVNPYSGSEEDIS